MEELLESRVQHLIGEITRTDGFTDPRHPDHYACETIVNKLYEFKSQVVPKLQIVGAPIEH